jgi:hypothetical protein
MSALGHERTWFLAFNVHYSSSRTANVSSGYWHQAELVAMQRALVIILLLAILAGAVFVDHYGWVLAGDVVMPGWGWLMLGLGIFFTLLVGFGLKDLGVL